ncbi:alcohol dehydrogenase catalytic domain-containing protein [Actinomadura opuntiae]|uniref:alcohol dehydrogenase catalytic domain-containing protein n=1 Tax=Actinomadura sp. OS1-43 TaxID=604315 RepID=UPI00255AF708|nr:alcohol dehydrogenase catalytic domain-containing protein [Actinomadura sp. OS1-43]MDL4821097.1 alcohol dehydrogenase catalytic domain-containing protein [Actinomadura sp. OS1-43]
MSKTMTAVRIHEHGGPEVLKVEQVPVPEPAPGEVLVRVRATSVNWWDAGYRKGIVQPRPGVPSLPLPFQLGREAAGQVTAVGSGVRSFTPGDRVVVMTCPACGRCTACRRGDDNLCQDTQLPGHQRFGGYAEYVTAPQNGLLKAPDGVDFETLACVLWSYGTVLHMVNARARIQPGDTVLVTGASGGMGTAALQLSRLAGAQLIIALTGSADKTDALLTAGADIALNYKDPDIVEQIRAQTGGTGVDVVLDNVGGPMLPLAIKASRLGGKIVLAAVMGGRTAEVHIGEVFAKHLDILGTRASTRREQELVLQFAAAGKIAPVIGARYPLTQAATAHKALDAGSYVGKIVLVP